MIRARVYNLGDNRSATSPYSTLVGGPVERVVDLRKKSRSGRGYSAWCFIIVEWDMVLNALSGVGVMYATCG